MRIVVLHAGGLGDLVLAETLLSGLRDRYPEARIEVLCRADVAPVLSLYARVPDAVSTFAFNPYTWAVPRIAAADSLAFLAQLPRTPVDLFISAELRATWLSEILAAALEPAQATFGDASVLDVGAARIALRLMGLRPRPGIERLASVVEHELDRYARMIEGERRVPQLRSLRRQMPDGERPLAVFALGTPHIKQWPFERVAKACGAIVAADPRPLVLVGSPQERGELERLACIDPTRLFSVAPSSDDFEIVAETIANAAGYIGIDTGLAHVAAAFGVPGVTVYGGGTWPAYAPWAIQSAGVVAPIPCFGCAWDCAFGHAYCVTAIGVAEVVQAYEDVRASDADKVVILEREAYDSEERTLFARAAHVYREAQADRAARFRGILRLRDILERYTQRSRTRQSTVAALPDLTDRLTAVTKRLNERAAPNR